MPRIIQNDSSSIKNLQRFHFSEDWNLLTPIRSDTNLNIFIYTKSTAFLSRIICFYSKVVKKSEFIRIFPKIYEKILIFKITNFCTYVLVT